MKGNTEQCPNCGEVGWHKSSEGQGKDKLHEYKCDNVCRVSTYYVDSETVENDIEELQRLVERWRRWSTYGGETKADIGYNQGLRTAAADLETHIEYEASTSDYSESSE